MHQALVRTGRERVRAIGRHRAFGGHAGMADAVGAAHARKVEAPRHIRRQADFLVKLDPLARADDDKIGPVERQPAAHAVFVRGGNFEYEMGVAHRALRIAYRGRDAGKVHAAQGQLDAPFPARSVDREAGAVGAAIAHHRQHAGQQRAQFRLQ